MENQQVLSDRPAAAGGRRLSPATGSSIRCACTSRRGTEENVGDQLQPILGLGAAQRARQAAVRRPAQPRARPDDGQYPARAEPRRPPIWRRDRRRPDQACRPARRHAARIPPIERMRTARQQEARSIEAQGHRQAQIIRAEADAEAAATYARRLQPGSGFLRFLPRDAVLPRRASSPSPDGEPRGRTSIILSPNNEYLRQFSGGGGTEPLKTTSGSHSNLRSAALHSVQRDAGGLPARRPTRMQEGITTCVTSMALPPPSCSAAPPRRLSLSPLGAQTAQNEPGAIAAAPPAPARR